MVVWLVNRRAFEPDLDCLPLVNVADDPTRFEHNPHHGVRRVRSAALRYLHTVNKDKGVFAVIVKLTGGVVHGPYVPIRHSEIILSKKNPGHTDEDCATPIGQDYRAIISASVLRRRSTAAGSLKTIASRHWSCRLRGTPTPL
jgi:hypothetical protein